MHPDKAVPNEAKNETLETINDHWVEVSKAFKALTDEEIRNNYIQYGHPDGKQGFSIGIALPKFIITEGNGKYVLLVYGLLLGVLLPYSVGKWWYGTQRMTKEKVLLASASNLFREYKDDMTDGDLVNALSSGQEYAEVLSGSKADAGLGKIEQTLLREEEAGSNAAGLSSKDREKLSSYEGVRRKSAALIWAYLGRLKLDGSTLDEGWFPWIFSNHLLIYNRKIRSRSPCPQAPGLFFCRHPRFQQYCASPLRISYFAVSDSGCPTHRLATSSASTYHARYRQFHRIPSDTHPSLDSAVNGSH